MEQEIIQRAQRGDQRAFQQIIEDYGQLAWRTAYVLLPDRTQIDDAMQEAWLDVWRGLAAFQPGRPLRPWLLAIVANRCRMFARRQRMPTLSLEADFIADPTAANDTEARALRSESDAELHAALATLTPEQQRILQLHFFADLSLSDIAIVTASPLGSVKSRLHRALQALRARLRPAHPYAAVLEDIR